MSSDRVFELERLAKRGAGRLKQLADSEGWSQSDNNHTHTQRNMHIQQCAYS